MNLFDAAYAALMTADPDAKCHSVATLYNAWQSGPLDTNDPGISALAIPVPGRPPKPDLVPPREVRHRGLGSPEGRAALIHALTHIEFNAINLALDAVYRFRDMPAEFFGDWLQVAAEEAYHFGLLRDHLKTLGFDYGDFSAHNGLWDMTVKTAHDPLVRMALVPRLLEARGLDVTPGIRNKLMSVGDRAAAEILDIILRDEVGHVAIGNRWYHRMCLQRGLDPLSTFDALLREYAASPPQPPFNRSARAAAGFSEAEMAWLAGER